MKKTLISIATLLAVTSAFATNGTTPTGDTVTVGDNRYGQVAAQGSAIANGGANYGGTANGGVATTTGGTAYGGVGGTVGPQTVQQSANNSNAGIVGQGGAGGKGGAGGSAAATASISGTVGGTASSNGNTVKTSSTNVVIVDQADNDSTVAAARELADQKIRNTPNVSGPALTSSNDTCMGSVSAGGSGPGIGLSFGTSYTDDNCVMLKNARELWNFGMRAAAIALMCTNTANRHALEITGYNCPSGNVTKLTKTADAPVVYEPTDPIVRKRMGLPPIKE